jgi:hypothetical protein
MESKQLVIYNLPAYAEVLDLDEFQILVDIEKFSLDQSADVRAYLANCLHEVRSSLII